MYIFANSVDATIDPVSFVSGAIGVDDAALTVGFVFEPRSFIFGAVGPEVNAAALSQACFGPLTNVDLIILQLEWTFGEQLRWVVFITVKVLEHAPGCLHLLGYRSHQIGHFGQFFQGLFSGIGMPLQVHLNAGSEPGDECAFRLCCRLR